MRPTVLIARSLVVLVALSAAWGAYVATEDSGDTLATNGVNLKIDSKGWYNGVVVPSATWKLKDLVPGVDKFFNYEDVKPGDFGCEVISMHVKNQDAYLCLDFDNLTSAENGINEPESDDEPGGAGGELASRTEFFGWIDDGDGKYEPKSFEKKLFGVSPAASALNDKSYAVGDSKERGACKAQTTKYVGMCWCAGKLTVDSKTGKMACDGSGLGNLAQTDSWNVDVSIRAQPAKDKPKFVCGSMPPKYGGKNP